VTHRGPCQPRHAGSLGFCWPGDRAPSGAAGPGTPGLTSVVLHQLLQCVEAAARGDVEAAAIQRPDLVMLHRAALQLVPVPHRQRVAACPGGVSCRPLHAHPSRTGGTHRAVTRQSRRCSPLPTALPRPPRHEAATPAPRTPKAASQGHIPRPCRGARTCGSTEGLVGTPSPCPAAKLSPGWGPISSRAQPSGPFVVSLSRIMKDPTVFPGPRSCRSASFRLMPLKNHLQQNQTNQRTLPGLARGSAGGRTRGSPRRGARDTPPRDGLTPPSPASRLGRRSCWG